MENFRNNQVELADFPRWEEVSFQRIAGSYKYVIVLNYMILALFLSLIALVPISLNNIELFDVKVLYIGAGILFLVLLLCTLHLWSYMRWAYALREKDVLYRAGIFTRRVEIVPYKHIQHVQVKEGVFSRLFSLVSIEVFTAGSGKSIQIPGIPREHSAQIQAFISERISAIHVQ